jgi:hypothetical protein
MCLQTSSVRASQKWHWAGDAIVHDPSIPASRSIPGSGKKRYPIDVRGFLSIEGNAVVRRHLEKLAAGLTEPDRVFFQSRLTGSFDSRAIHVADYVGRNLRYRRRPRTFDNWLFPEETLAVRGGDCEDLAFVLAVLLEASGVSPYNIRVAFGSVVDRSGSLERNKFDHAWVMYKAVSGAWQILEPLAILGRHRRRQAPSSLRRLKQKRTVPDLDYVPHFVFNRTHLWKVNSDEDDAASNIRDYMSERRTFWKGFEPSFAASVHAQIFDDALSDMSAIDLDRVKLSSLMIDIDTLKYDPRDHFDFAYISEGWKRVPERLATGDLTDFARAVHAVGDFYAHTLYADFALVRRRLARPSALRSGLAPPRPRRSPTTFLLTRHFRLQRLCRRGRQCGREADQRPVVEVVLDIPLGPEETPGLSHPPMPPRSRHGRSGWPDQRLRSPPLQRLRVLRSVSPSIRRRGQARPEDLLGLEGRTSKVATEELRRAPIESGGPETRPIISIREEEDT